MAYHVLIKRTAVLDNFGKGLATLDVLKAIQENPSHSLIVDKEQKSFLLYLFDQDVLIIASVSICTCTSFQNM